MKIIDLLNKIANGNIPKRIIYDQFVYVWNSKIENYQREVDEMTTLNWDYITINCLNEPVEILDNLEEEKKIPEKIKSNGKKFYCDNIDSWIDKEETSAYCEYLMNKYNDLIDYLKSKGE